MSSTLMWGTCFFPAEVIADVVENASLGVECLHRTTRVHARAKVSGRILHRALPLTVLEAGRVEGQRFRGILQCDSLEE